MVKLSLPHHLSDCMTLFWGMAGQNKNKRLYNLTAKSIPSPLSLNTTILGCGGENKKKGHHSLQPS